MYGAAVEGYTWDFSRSVVAGGKWSAAQNEGMAIAIECMAGREDVGFVKFEHNILVHSDRIELISTCPARL